MCTQVTHFKKHWYELDTTSIIITSVTPYKHLCTNRIHDTQIEKHVDHVHKAFHTCYKNLKPCLKGRMHGHGNPLDLEKRKVWFY